MGPLPKEKSGKKNKNAAAYRMKKKNGLGIKREIMQKKWPIIFFFFRSFWVKEPPSFRNQNSHKKVYLYRNTRVHV